MLDAWSDNRQSRRPCILGPAFQGLQRSEIMNVRLEGAYVTITLRSGIL